MKVRGTVINDDYRTISTSDQIGEKFVAIVVTQQEYRFRKLGFESGGHEAFGPRKNNV